MTEYEKEIGKKNIKDLMSNKGKDGEEDGPNFLMI